MQDLHLVGFTKDHRHLIFSTRKDAKSGGYVVPVDDDLIDAVDEVVNHRAEHPDEGAEGADDEPTPPRVESQLSVREVQARLRSGDDASQIASDAGVDVEWVERFAMPILAEQRRVVDRALTVPLTRPRAGESAVPLRRAIAAAMAERRVDFTPEGFEAAWSAYLVGGGEWVVTFEFPNRGRRRTLQWDFDLASGTLTTSDRFASQLAFVDDADELPPPEATVGAEVSRAGSQLSRGPLTSGGLARPGSGRVIEPSTSAMPLPPVVRPASPLSEPLRREPGRPDPPRAGVDRSVAPSPWPERPRSEPRPPTAASPEPRSTEPRPTGPAPTAPSEPPPRPPAPEPRQSAPAPAPSRRPAPTPPVARPAQPSPAPPRPASDEMPASRPPAEPTRQPLAAQPDRPAPAPVPPRRPAPVAPPTNATRSHTQRPVREVAPRMPVTMESDAAARRREMIEDEHALDDVVRSQPPRHGESVVILRAVDPEPDDELDAGDPEHDYDDALDESFADERLADVDEYDDDDEGEGYDEAVDDEYGDDYDDDLYDEDEEYDDEVEVDDDVEAVDDEYEDDDHDYEDDDDLYDDEYGEADADDLSDPIDPDDDDDRDDDDQDEDAALTSADAEELDDEIDDDEDLEDAAEDDEDDPQPRPVRASVRRASGTAGRGRLVARREPLVAAPEPSEAEPDTDTGTETDDGGRRSSVQFRPGSATQAGSARDDVNDNGRDDDTDEDDGDAAATDEGSPPQPRRRRRRTEPLRAR